MTEKSNAMMNRDPLDTLIERTLVRDAESTRERFAAIPNPELTSKLALTTASRGFLSTLAAKLALYAGAAVVIGGAIYFIPKLSEQPSATIAVPSVVHSAHPALAPQNATTAKDASATSSSKANVSSKPGGLTPSGTPHHIQLDEGDDKNPTVIIDKLYGPPLK